MILLYLGNVSHIASYSLPARANYCYPFVYWKSWKWFYKGGMVNNYEMLVLTYIMRRLWQLVYKESEPNFKYVFSLFFIDENSKLLSMFYLSFFAGPSKHFCGEGNGNPLQCSCLENPRDGGAWWAAVYGVAQSWTRLKWLSSSSSQARFIYLFKSALGLPCCEQAFSRCTVFTAVWGPLLAVVFLLLLQSTGSRVLAQQLWHLDLGLIVLHRVVSLRTRDRACVPCISRSVLNHWTTKECSSTFLW